VLCWVGAIEMCEKTAFVGGLVGCCVLFGVLVAAAPPPAPASVSAVFVPWNKIVVSWTAVSASPPVVKYRIYIDNFSACGCSRWDERTAPTTTFEDSCVQYGLTHSYAVSAVNSAGEEGPTTFGQVNVPWRRPDGCAEITSLTWRESEGRVEITWKEVDTAQSYQIWRSTSPTGGETAIGAAVPAEGGYQMGCPGSQMTYTDYDDTAERGTPYYYQVQAINQGGSTPLSSSCTTSLSIPGAPTNVPPTASFTFDPPSPLPGETITFDARGSSDPDGSIVNYEWQFGDGTTTSGADKDVVTHAYGTATAYTVLLIVADDRGATGSRSRDVTVVTPGNVPPVADFLVSPGDPKMGDLVQFDASASQDSDGTIVAYQWNFGDGGTATGQVVQHTYAAAGTYGAHLTVQDDRGAIGEHAQVITVAVRHALAPSITLKCGAPACNDNGGKIDISWSATDDSTPAGNIEYRYALEGEKWSGWSTRTQPALAISGLENGYYAFNLEARDAEGNVAEASCNFAILCTPTCSYALTTTHFPLVGGSVARSPDKSSYCNGDSVTLTANPSSGWTFDHWEGDASGKSKSVTITMSGKKSVTAYFTSTSAGSCTYSLTTQVSPSGAGTVTPSPRKSSYCKGDSVTLTAQPSSGWTFDHWGGDLSGTTNPVGITMNGNKSVTAYFVAVAPSAPTLSVSPSSLDFGTSETSKTFEVWNSGGGTLLFAVSSDNSVLKLDPTSGALGGYYSAHKTITVTLGENPILPPGLSSSSATITVTPYAGEAREIAVSWPAPSQSAPLMPALTAAPELPDVTSLPPMAGGEWVEKVPSSSQVPGQATVQELHFSKDVAASCRIDNRLTEVLAGKAIDILLIYAGLPALMTDLMQRDSCSSDVWLTVPLSVSLPGTYQITLTGKWSSTSSLSFSGTCANVSYELRSTLEYGTIEPGFHDALAELSLKTTGLCPDAPVMCKPTITQVGLIDSENKAEPYTVMETGTQNAEWDSLLSAADEDAWGGSVGWTTTVDFSSPGGHPVWVRLHFELQLKSPGEFMGPAKIATSPAKYYESLSPEVKGLIGQKFPAGTIEALSDFNKVLTALGYLCWRSGEASAEVVVKDITIRVSRITQIPMELQQDTSPPSPTPLPPPGH